MRRPDWTTGLEECALKNKVDTIVLLGMVIKEAGAGMDRDVAVYSKDDAVRNKVRTAWLFTEKSIIIEIS